MVVDTIEDALRQGGLALFDEGFQLDSSLNWVFGENIKGEFDAVVPLWSKSEHAVFVQPGFVFWTGLADEERIDGNLGIAYRTSLTDDIIGGASAFYDRDLKQGHSRISLGADVQGGFFHGAANYYQPLSDEEDGREGFIEKALRGVDFRLAFQRDVMRVSGNLGYWRFEGDGTMEADWKISYGLDAGIRVFPGVFIEGGWERHDEDVSIDSRWNAGLAFRFSLPDFKGANYGDGSTSTNLWQIVEREKRILYEERVAGPAVSLASSSSENIEEGGTVSITAQLSEALEEDVTLNLIGSGTATYGVDSDWKISVGGTDCASANGTSCQITIEAGDISGATEVSVRDDGLGESAETIIIAVEIASAGSSNLMLGSPSVLSLVIPQDPPIPTVTLARSGNGDVQEGGTETITIALSRALKEDVVLNLIGGGDATYGAGNDWQLNNGTSDCNAVTGTSCQITIAAGSTSADATISVLTDAAAEDAETITVTVAIASAGSTKLELGSLSSQTIPIPLHLPTVTLNYSGSMTVRESTDQNGVVMTINLSEALADNVTLSLVGSGSAVYSRTSVAFGGTGDYQLRRRSVAAGGMASSSVISANGCLGITGSSCEVTLQAGQTIADVHLEIYPDGLAESPETIILSIAISSASASLVELGSTSSQTITIDGEAS